MGVGAPGTGVIEAAMWVLRIKQATSAKALSVLNYRANSPAPPFFLTMCIYCLKTTKESKTIPVSRLGSFDSERCLFHFTDRSSLVCCLFVSR